VGGELMFKRRLGCGTDYDNAAAKGSDQLILERDEDAIMNSGTMMIVLKLSRRCAKT